MSGNDGGPRVCCALLPESSSIMKSVVTVVAGGQPMFLDLLSTWLAARVDVRVVAVAGDVHTAVAACVGHRPDLLVLEPTALAEDGRSVVAALADINPAASVVVLADSQQPPSGDEFGDGPDQVQEKQKA